MTTALEAARAAYIKARDEYHAAQDACHRAGLYNPELFDAKEAAFAAFNAARSAYFDACYAAEREVKP